MLRKTSIFITLLLALAVLTALCSCGKTGGTDGTKTGKAPDYSGLYEYAKRLEAEGNADAAAAVYEIIIKNGGKDFLAGMHEDVGLIKLDDEINEIEDIFGRKEADGK